MRHLREHMREIYYRAKEGIHNKRAEMYIDKVIGIIISVVIGGLLLVSLSALYKDTILPSLADKIESLFI